MTTRIGTTLAALAIAVSTAVVIVTASLLPFLNPWWVAFEQDRAQAAVWTGYPPAELRRVTDAILGDLVVGPPDFDVTVAGEPVLTAAERGHMRDVRTVFLGLWAATALAALTLVVGANRMRRAAFWRCAGRGAAGLAIAVVAAGGIGVVAFDALFDTFHRIFFPAGNWAFDPRTDRLVQLFPYQFWFETALAAGAVMLLLAGLVTLAVRASTARGDGAPRAVARTARDPAR